MISPAFSVAFEPLCNSSNCHKRTHIQHLLPRVRRFKSQHARACLVVAIVSTQPLKAYNLLIGHTSSMLGTYLITHIEDIR